MKNKLKLITLFGLLTLQIACVSNNNYTPTSELPPKSEVSQQVLNEELAKVNKGNYHGCPWVNAKKASASQQTNGPI